jgi:hypothetical protein
MPSDGDSSSLTGADGSSEDGEKKKGGNGAVIVVVVILVIGAILGGVFCCCCRNKKQETSPFDEDLYDDEAPSRAHLTSASQRSSVMSGKKDVA